ncbi:PH domain-containing protein [Nocardioides limicola]|uniref:PH domain-containing protein n=1 Tax=Nocardioides limicola TaxID=2803368 RepID=UPI00193C7FAC|nr:PH domain-containing protein [Nocardioides sp. DJM-14]
MTEVTLPHTWRPFGVRMAALLVGVGLAVVCAAAWFAFPPEIRAMFTLFQKGTLVVMGAGLFVMGHALVRSKVVATEAGLVVVNGYRTREFAWPQALAVRLPAGAPWAVLDLADGTSCPMMGIQGSDGAQARRAVLELRSLLDRP